MGYEQSKFGDGSGTGSGNVTTAVNNHYGPRETGKTVGSNFTEGQIRELVLDIDGEMIGDAAFALLAPKLPAGSIVKEAFVEVTEVFVVGGTSPTINIGTEGSEGTNGLEVTEAQAEALGTYDVTSSLQGTWASPLAAETTVGIAMDGTSPTITDAGKMRVVVRYVRF
jgi:hypothetical protein